MPYASAGPFDNAKVRHLEGVADVLAVAVVCPSNAFFLFQSDHSISSGMLKWLSWRTAPASDRWVTLT